MAKENKSGNITKKGSISEGTMKKGSVNKAPTTSRPSKPIGQGGSSSGVGKKK